MADIQTYHVQTHAGIRHVAGRDEFWTQTLIVDFTGSLPAVEIRSWGRVGTKEQARFYATGVSASQAANLRVVMEGWNRSN